MKALQNTLDHIFMLFIDCIRIPDAMETDSPFSRHIIHLQPRVRAVVKLSQDLDSVPVAGNGLVVRPVPSKLNIILDIFELNVAFGIEVLRRKL